MINVYVINGEFNENYNKQKMFNYMNVRNE